MFRDQVKNRTYVAKATTSSSYNNDFVRCERRKLLRVNGRVDVAVQRLRELEGSGQHVGVEFGSHCVFLKRKRLIGKSSDTVLLMLKRRRSCLSCCN